MKMNYQTILKTTLLACTVGIMAACSSDGYDDETPYLAQNYSNKLADGDKANLALTYSGSELIGKNVTFRTSDSKTGTLKLQNILPHETETTLSNVSLISDGKGGYSFNGMSTTPLNTTFSFKGKVNGEKMSLDLTDIKVPASKATGKLTIVMSDPSYFPEGVKKEIDGKLVDNVYEQKTPIYAQTDNEDIAIIYLIGTFAGTQINDALQSLTFETDGNLIATYKDKTTNTWKESPKNLLTYYVEGDSAVYITPNVDMIINEIQKGQQKTRGISATTPSDLEKAYAQLNKWSTTGIKFAFKENPYNFNSGKAINVTGNYWQYEGDYVLYLTKDEIKDMLPLVDLFQDKIINALPDDYKDMVGMMLPTLLQGINKANVFELGFCLNKTK